MVLARVTERGSTSTEESSPRTIAATKHRSRSSSFRAAIPRTASRPSCATPGQPYFGPSVVGRCSTGKLEDACFWRLYMMSALHARRHIDPATQLEDQRESSGQRDAPCGRIAKFGPGRRGSAAPPQQQLPLQLRLPRRPCLLCPRAGGSAPPPSSPRTGPRRTAET